MGGKFSRATYIGDSAGAHRHDSRRPKGLDDTKKYKSAIVGWYCSQKDIGNNIDGERDDV